MDNEKNKKTSTACGAPGCPGCPRVKTEVATRIAAYTPKVLPAPVWDHMASQVRCVVRRTRPGSVQVAKYRLSTLCGALATTTITGTPALAEVLTTPMINAYLRGQSQRTGANRKAVLERLRQTALGVPYRGGNTADPAAKRSRAKRPAAPTLGQRALLERVCAPAPLLGTLTEPGTGYDQVHQVTAFLPPADLPAHREVLRGQLCAAGVASPTGVGTALGVSHHRPKGTAMSPVKVSKAAIRRAAAAAAAAQAAPPPPLPDYAAKHLASFVPQSVPRHLHPVVTPAVIEVMSRAGHLQGEATFIKRTVDVTALTYWALRTGRGLGWQELMDHEVIFAYARVEHASLSQDSLAHRTRRLLRLASVVNPGPSAPPPLSPTPYAAVKAPYTTAQMAVIHRLVRNQPSAVIGRKLAAIVALARGAGATSSELGRLRARDIEDLGVDGVMVTLRGKEGTRVVPLRRAYEDMARAAVADLAPGRLVVATGGGANTVNRVLAAVSDLSGQIGTISASRLRTTWIAELMCQPIGLHVLLAVAGLRSARTVTSVAEHITTTPGDYTAAAGILRGPQQ